MKFKIVNIEKVCHSGTVTRDDGQIIHDILKEHWDKEKRIMLDFKGLLIASVSFLDEAFGKLTFEHSKDQIVEKLSFRNMDDRDRALLSDIMISRFKQVELSKKPRRKQNPSRRRKR